MDLLNIDKKISSVQRMSVGHSFMKLVIVNMCLELAETAYAFRLKTFPPVGDWNYIINIVWFFSPFWSLDNHDTHDMINIVWHFFLILVIGYWQNHILLTTEEEGVVVVFLLYQVVFLSKFSFQTIFRCCKKESIMSIMWTSIMWTFVSISKSLVQFLVQLHVWKYFIK